MPTFDNETLSLIAAFQRLAKTGDPTETNAYDLATLQRLDIALGNRDLDAAYRLALRDRISAVESKNAEKRQSTIRVVGYVVAFALAVLATIAAEHMLR